MSDVKIGWSQTSKPSPLGYRKFMNAYIVCIAPATGSLLAAWGLTADHLAKALLIVGYSTALVKGLGMVLGNGQVYTPTNETVDNQSAAK